MSRPRPNGCYGAATGRTRTRPPSPTMPGCSIFSASGRRARQRDAVSWSRIRKFFTALRRLPSFLHLLVELHLGVAEEDEIRRRDRDRAVDAEHRDLEFVAGVDGFGEHDAVGHVEALDGGGARMGVAAGACAATPDDIITGIAASAAHASRVRTIFLCIDFLPCSEHAIQTDVECDIRNGDGQMRALRRSVLALLRRLCGASTAE